MKYLHSINKPTFLASLAILLALLFVPTFIFNLTVDYKSLEAITNTTTQNTRTLYYKDNKLNTEAVLETLKDAPLETEVLFKTVYKKDGQIIVEPIYQSEELSQLVDSYALTTVESYNAFLETVEFEPEPVCYSPVDLFESGKGNCYSFTLLTMFLLDKYFPTQRYEVLTDFYDNGDSHIYLKLIGEKEDIICDLTKDKHFQLPS